MLGVLPHSMSEAVRGKDPDKLSPYESVLRSFSYHERLTPEEHALQLGLAWNGPSNRRRVMPMDGPCCRLYSDGSNRIRSTARSPGPRTRCRAAIRRRGAFQSPCPFRPGLRPPSFARSSRPSEMRRSEPSRSTLWTEAPLSFWANFLSRRLGTRLCLGSAGHPAQPETSGMVLVPPFL